MCLSTQLTPQGSAHDSQLERRGREEATWRCRLSTLLRRLPASDSSVHSGRALEDPLWLSEGTTTSQELPAPKAQLGPSPAQYEHPVGSKSSLLQNSVDLVSSSSRTHPSMLRARKYCVGGSDGLCADRSPKPGRPAKRLKNALQTPTRLACCSPRSTPNELTLVRPEAGRRTLRWCAGVLELL